MGLWNCREDRSRLTGDLGFTMEEMEGSLGFRGFISRVLVMHLLDIKPCVIDLFLPFIVRI